MCTIPTGPAESPAGRPSAYGGVLVLREAWQALTGEGWMPVGLCWRGRGGALVLFALVALPVLGCASVRAVATCCGRVGDPLWAALGWAETVTQRRLARFVTSERHDWAAVQAAMVARLAQHPATAVPLGTAVLAVDSTVAEKRFGPQLPGVRPVYDAVRRRLVDGWEIVSGCVVGPAGAWPLGLVPHRPPAPGERAPRRRRKAEPGEAPSKLDLALALVLTAVGAGVGAPTVVGDGAFAVNWWLRELTAVALPWLVATRQDRRLRIGATIRPFAAWLEHLPVVWACVVSLPGGGGIYGGLLPEATLLDKGRQQQGLLCRPAYFERRDRQGRVRHRWYLVTSQRQWDAALVWAHWQRRWAIEVFHRDAKQWFQCTAMHGRRWAGLEGWLACCSLRASLLAFLRAAEPAWGTQSTEAAVRILRTAACLVTPQPGAPASVMRPPTLPQAPTGVRLAPLRPAPQWPLMVEEAA